MGKQLYITNSIWDNLGYNVIHLYNEAQNGV